MVLSGAVITCSPPVTLTLGEIHLHFILRISGDYIYIYILFTVLTWFDGRKIVSGTSLVILSSFWCSYNNAVFFNLYFLRNPTDG